MGGLVVTKDGSHTIAIPGKGVTYHSVHGAIRESKHVFIAGGLLPLAERLKSICVFEMSFGTELNAFLTAIYAAEKEFMFLTQPSRQRSLPRRSKRFKLCSKVGAKRSFSPIAPKFMQRDNVVIDGCISDFREGGGLGLTVRGTQRYEQGRMFSLGGQAL